MYIIPKTKPKIYLISDLGTIYVYNSIEEAGLVLYKLLRDYRYCWRSSPGNSVLYNTLFGNEFKRVKIKLFNDFDYEFIKIPRYILRDEYENTITYDEIKQHFPVVKLYWARYSRVHTKPEHFRKLPVPNTGKPSYGWYSNRKIKINNEYKQLQLMISDEELNHYKFKRRPKRLNKIKPDYDNGYRTDRDHRSWKRHRKNQWK